MKTLLSMSLSFSLFLMGPTVSKAQEKSALNFSLMGGASSSRITKDSFENTISYNIGSVGRYFFLEHFGAGLGLEFEARKLGTKDIVSNLEDGTAHYLDIPILVSSRFGSFAHRGSIDVGGIYAISLTDRTGEGSGFSAAYVQPESSFGFNMRGGYEYVMKSNFGIGVELSMKYLPSGAMRLGIGSVVDDNDQHFISVGTNLRLSYGLL